MFGDTITEGRDKSVAEGGLGERDKGHNREQDMRVQKRRKFTRT